MDSQILALVIVVGFSSLYLMNWKASLKRRKVLESKVIEILERKKYTDIENTLIAGVFIVSGKHFAVSSFLMFEFNKIIRQIFLSKNTEIRKSKNKNIKVFKNKNFAKDITPIAKEAITINFMMSPVQFILGALLLLIFLLIGSICKPIAKSMSQTTAANAFMEYAENKQAKT
ncbi:hypothetical protein HWV01_16040 [Moritella sp. 5]|uniref:hypothetical protein n=1 Tax=Moritella sp. 5 TaxID=2746231 RepID=UPI001BAD458B|nr:hypothetical protein [Moritella sp. 5]QUM81684.1 hypothetical protein HWV01_16040 [Moritella sp. 5]